jgi:hypothetical protein
MRQRWCHNHKMLDIKQRETVAWYGQTSRPSRCSLHPEEFTFGEQQRKRTIWNTWSQRWNTADVLASNIAVFFWSHYYPSWSNYCKGESGEIG